MVNIMDSMVQLDDESFTDALHNAKRSGRPGVERVARRARCLLKLNFSEQTDAAIARELGDTERYVRNCRKRWHEREGNSMYDARRDGRPIASGGSEVGRIFRQFGKPSPTGKPWDYRSVAKALGLTTHRVHSTISLFRPHLESWIYFHTHPGELSAGKLQIVRFMLHAVDYHLRALPPLPALRKLDRDSEDTHLLDRKIRRRLKLSPEKTRELDEISDKLWVSELFYGFTKLVFDYHKRKPES